jgi:hypothetical protein
MRTAWGLYGTCMWSIWGRVLVWGLFLANIKHKCCLKYGYPYHSVSEIMQANEQLNVRQTEKKEFSKKDAF